MVILKRGADPRLLRNLSTLNVLAGGRDFYNDRTPRFHNADGGFIARAAAAQSQVANQRSIAEELRSVPIYTKITDLHRLDGQVAKADFVNELS
jgi:hypothetical protein